MCFSPPQGCCHHPGGRGAVPLPPGGQQAEMSLQPPKVLLWCLWGWHLKAARSVGLYMTLGHFMQVLFCGTSCPLCHSPTARGPGEALQAPMEVSVLLREARSARRCNPPASTEFSMSPESQQGNSNYAQGTGVQNKPMSPAGHKSLAKIRQGKT